jgi:hypothetical protein
MDFFVKLVVWYNQTFFLVYSCYIYPCIIFFFIFINVGVRVSLRAPRLISRALKLTTMEASSDHHISNHKART